MRHILIQNYTGKRFISTIKRHTDYETALFSVHNGQICWQPKESVISKTKAKALEAHGKMIDSFDGISNA
jgi:hypothetical protein